MSYVQLAPLGGILDHQKTDFGVFWPFWAIISIYIKFAKCNMRYLCSFLLSKNCLQAPCDLSLEVWKFGSLPPVELSLLACLLVLHQTWHQFKNIFEFRSLEVEAACLPASAPPDMAEGPTCRNRGGSPRRD